MKNNKFIKIFTLSLLSFLFLPSHAQISNNGASIGMTRNNNSINKNIYPFLQQWSDLKSENLLNKIESYYVKNKNTAIKDRSYSAWHMRKIIYYSSSCLNKAIFIRPEVPSKPYSLDYSKRLDKISENLQLKDDDFPLPNERVFNQFCSNIIEANFDSGYCEVPKIKTIAVDMRVDFSVVDAINMTNKAKELQKYVPIKCALTSMTPEMLETYDAKATYTILKPFSLQSVQTPQGTKTLNVGEANISLGDALSSDGKIIGWQTKIIQHQVP